MTPAHPRAVPPTVSAAAPLLEAIREPAEKRVSRVPRSYSVRLADLEHDRDTILAIRRRNLAASAHHADGFDWYYRNGPYGPGKCWLLIADPGQEIVGTAGLGLRRLQIGGKTVLAGVASDFAVDSAHRSFQPALLLQKAVLATRTPDMPLIYGIPNKNSVGIFQRVGYRKVITLQRHARALRFGAYVSQMREPLPKARLLVELFDHTVRFAAKTAARLLSRHALTVLPEFDDRFDDLWQRASGRFDCIGERTSAFLRWRFAECPDRAYQAAGLIRPDGSLRGYAVYFRNNNHMHCADVLTEDDGPALRATIQGLVQLGIATGATSLSFTCGDASYLLPVLQRNGLIARPAEPSAVQKVMVTTESAAPDADRLMSWHFLLGDEDYN